jgi:hypothetical protein
MAMRFGTLRPLAALALGSWLSSAAVAQVAQPPQTLTQPTPPPTEAAVAAPMTPDHGGNGAAGGWYAEGEALYWHRDVPRRFLAFNDTGGGLATFEFFDTKVLHMDYEPGLGVKVGCAVDGGLGFEAGFMGFEEWHDTKTLGGSLLNIPRGGGFFQVSDIISEFPVFVSPFDAGLFFRQNYESRLHMGEANARATWSGDSGTVSLLAGFRYVHLYDKYNLTAEGTTSGFVGSPLLISQYATSAENNLFGFQVGIDGFVNLGQSLRLQIAGKVGLFDNFARQRSVISNALIGGVTPFNVFAGAENDRVACVTEFGVFLHWWAGESIGVNVGFRGMFLTDVALAPQQLSFLTTPGAQNFIDTSGNVFYYGPSAGIEFRW